MKTKKAMIRLRRSNDVCIDLSIELQAKGIKNIMRQLADKIPEDACSLSVLEYIYFYEITDFKISDITRRRNEKPE